MSILIKGMEMPTSCCQCPVNMYLCKRGYEYLLEHPALYDERDADCPLVHVPPHGRLIDADVLIDAIIAKYIRHERNRELVFAAAEIKQDLADIINELPTIIPAEEGET